MLEQYIYLVLRSALLAGPGRAFYASSRYGDAATATSGQYLLLSQDCDFM